MLHLRIAARLSLLVPLLFASHRTLAQSSFGALAAKAQIAREADRIDEAIGLYRKAVAVRPSWAEGWWNLGTLLYDRDSYAEAVGALSKAVALNPKSDVAVAMLGLAEAKLGQNPEAALRHINTGWRLGAGKEPQLRRVLLFTEGSLLLARGEFGKAQETLDVLARDGAEEEELILALGESVLGIRPGDLAPEWRQTVRQAGWAEHFAARSEFTEAAREYATLAAAAPGFHDVQFAYGRFLLASHEDGKAVEAFKREIANTPNHLLARLGIAGIEAVTDPPSGLPYAEEAVKLAPRLAEAHYLLGLLLLDTGATARAVTELETAQRQEPETAKIYFALSRAYSASGRTQDAAQARAKFARLSSEAKDNLPDRH